MAFPETPAHSSTGQPASVRVFDGVCLCGTAEVIISGGRRDFLVPVVAPRGAVPRRDSQLVSFNSPPSTPQRPPPRPLSPTRLLFPLKLHSVSFLPRAFEEALLRFSPSSGPGETRESLVKVSSGVYSTGGETGGLKGALFAFAAVDQE